MTDTTDRSSTGAVHPWRALAVCLVGGAMVLLDVSIVNVALPSIRIGLDASQSALQWVLSGYALTFGLALVPAGRMGDLIGRRTMFLVGLILFTLFSAVCGAAQSSTMLALARLAQGLAGGCLTPQISALIQQLFQGKERGKAFGLFGSVIGLSTAIGPLLGGALIEIFGDTEGWRWVFYVNLPVGIVLLPLAWKMLPAPRRASERQKESLDPVGVILLGVGVVLFLLPLVQEQQWHGRAKWLLIPLALLVLAGLWVWELRYARSRDPLLPLSLFSVRSYSFGSGLALFYFAGFTPLFFVLTLYLQIGLGYSPLIAGLSTIPFAVGAGLTANLAGRVALRFGRPLVAGGLMLVGVGFAGTLLAVHLVPSGHTGWATAIPLLVAGIGSGAVIAPNQTFTLAEVPERRAGTAGGVLQTGQRIGSAVGIAAVGSVFFARLASVGGASGGGSGGSASGGGASGGGSGGSGSGGGGSSAAAKPGSGALSSSYAHAYQVAMLVAIAFVLLALVIAVIDIVVNRAVQDSGAGPHDADGAGSGGAGSGGVGSEGADEAEARHAVPADGQLDGHSVYRPEVPDHSEPPGAHRA